MPTRAVVGVSAVALSSCASGFAGIARGMLLDNGVVLPDVVFAVTATSYCLPGCSPSIEQATGDAHVT